MLALFQQTRNKDHKKIKQETKKEKQQGEKGNQEKQRKT